MQSPHHGGEPPAISDVRFIMLGSGTSAGVPVIGCDCAVCRSSDPRDRRTRSGAALQFTDRTGAPRLLLLDTPPDLREQALRHRLERCDGILFTHNHVDHTFGLDDVRRFNAVMQAPIDVYGSDHTLEHLHRVFQHIFQKDRNVNDSFVATLIPHAIAADETIDLFGVRVTPIDLLHGRLPVLGFRFDALDAAGEIAASQPAPLPLAYCTDVSSIPPASWAPLARLHTLVLDMLRYRRHPTHLTVDEAVSIADRLGADRTWFTHMTHDILHADLDERLPEGMALGYDGLVVGEEGGQSGEERPAVGEGERQGARGG